MRINGPKDVGLLIRTRRTNRGWTQGDLARRIGSTQRWVSEVENGKETAEIGMVLQTMALLGIELNAGRPEPSDRHREFDLPEASDLDEIADAPGPRP